ncbi:hypothetical protein [Bilophila wadsworthia]|jgi:hypothetical protein|uniref:hypothetical protein n=1 Tax=Bilophila wadsworthia TaxID=35833 RepID=UPI00266B70D7|nr:hypothetical protein [Bilophila wadsworthia]
MNQTQRLQLRHPLYVLIPAPTDRDKNKTTFLELKLHQKAPVSNLKHFHFEKRTTLTPNRNSARSNAA